MNEDENLQQVEDSTVSQDGSLVLADGSDTGVSVDSATQVDALDPNGFAEISFTKGNYNNFAQTPIEVNKKVQLITKTVLPLIDVALIELLGNNKEFIRAEFNSTFTLNSMVPTFSVDTVYTIEKWLGNDIKEEYIQQDANYVYERIKVLPGVQFTQCKIDTNTGTLSISFTL